MSRHEPAVICHDVVKTYGKGEIAVRALRGVSLEARFGELLMIIGPSGCGKTTLLSVICGTLRADSGSIELFGKNISSMPDRELTAFRARHVGFIFQQFNLVPTLTARENVSIPRLLTGASYADAQKDAGAMLAQVGLAGREKSFPSQMSGGQQQRTAVARALLNDPAIILADEPTGNLDSTTTENVYNLLREINEKFGTTFIVITHDRHIAEKADRIIEIADGKINLDIRK